MTRQKKSCRRLVRDEKMSNIYPSIELVLIFVFVILIDVVFSVFLMGKLASHDIIAEKEDICFIATMLMGVGTTLAEIDEEQGRTVEESSTAKKPKI